MELFNMTSLMMNNSFTRFSRFYRKFRSIFLSHFQLPELFFYSDALRSVVEFDAPYPDSCSCTGKVQAVLNQGIYEANCTSCIFQSKNQWKSHYEEHDLDRSSVQGLRLVGVMHCWEIRVLVDDYNRLHERFGWKDSSILEHRWRALHT